jgi:hypothetical protein
MADREVVAGRRHGPGPRERCSGVHEDGSLSRALLESPFMLEC